MIVCMCVSVNAIKKIPAALLNCMPTSLLPDTSTRCFIMLDTRPFSGPPHPPTYTVSQLWFQKLEHATLGSGLTETAQKRDLGVLADSSIKMSIQCAVAVKKANSILEIIKWCVENKTASIIIDVIPTMVIPRVLCSDHPI